MFDQSTQPMMTSFRKKEGKLSLKAKRRGADLQINRLIFSKKSDKGVGGVSELLRSEKVRERERERERGGR